MGKLQPVLTVTELAEHWKTSRSMVNRMLRSGAIHGFRLGGEKGPWRISVEEVLRYDREGARAIPRSVRKTRAPLPRPKSGRKPLSDAEVLERLKGGKAQ